MKKYTSTQRDLNIISKAIELGFEVDIDDSLDVITSAATDFLLDNAEIDRTEECTSFNGTGFSQHATWEDGMGYSWWQSGEILYYEAGQKVFKVSTVLDSEGRLVQLVHTVKA